MGNLYLYVQKGRPVNSFAGNPPRLARLFALLLCMLLLFRAAVAGAAEEDAAGGEERAGEAPEAVYRTPLAGKAYRTVLFGRRIDVPPFDRTDVRALSLGANVYTPPVGEETVTPIAALYWKKLKYSSRLRAVVSGFVNEVEVARRFGGLELIGRGENDTVPFPSTELSRNVEVKGSSIIWGTVTGFVGAGIRQSVYPFQADNDIRLQLFYQAGYLYSRPTEDTAPTVRLPPDTFIQGLRLRGRYDSMTRNIMELVHNGVALGFDVDLVRRNIWGDAFFGGELFRGEDTRDYVKMSAYLTVATKAPWLSERDRLIISLHGGYSPTDNLDRFSAFRIGGGLYPNEAEDMRRPYYPGALYNQFPSTDFFLANFEYRRELLFFLFLHLRGTIIIASRPDFHAEAFKFLKNRGEAFSVGITAGLPGKSQLYLEYGYDEEAIRDDVPGSSFLVLWSKCF